jgi:tetratricopeptide (TPR) repeat protein
LIKFKLSTGGKSTSLASISLLKLEKGMEVFSLGFPNGFEIEGGSTVSTGIISGFRKVDNQDLIQTTAPITHGSSGGGLFDKEGKLCGITSGTFASDIMDRHANLNKVIPVSSIKILKQNLNISLFEFYEKISKGNLFIAAMESYESHDFENAIISFSEHLKIFPDDAVAWFRMGNSFKEIGRRKPINRNLLEKALNCFEFAIDLDTNYYYPYGQSANVNMLLGNKDLAFEFAHKALNISSNFFTNGAIGRLYNQIGEYNKAVYYLTNAIQFSDDKQLDFMYVERGTAYDYLKKDEEALADLRKAIEINGQNEGALFFYAYKLILKERYSDACLHLKILHELNPRYTEGGNSVSNLIQSYCK